MSWSAGSLPTMSLWRRLGGDARCVVPVVHGASSGIIWMSGQTKSVYSLVGLNHLQNEGRGKSSYIAADVKHNHAIRGQACQQTAIASACTR